ncbi:MULTISPECIES: hypothetical protein [Cupriavidus]|uniref:hypothetical protein n=1 Tax=Cupriavidus sp. DF5525 TaxID=3160989 RepID=UPI0032DFA433
MAFDGSQPAAAFVGHDMAAQHMGPDRDHVERVAQLVRQDGDELVLHPVQSLDAGSCCLLAFAQLLLLAFEPDPVVAFETTATLPPDGMAAEMLQSRLSDVL